MLSWLGIRGAIAWLVGASAIFYARHIPLYVFLLLGSVVFNYFAGSWIGLGKSRTALFIRVALNLLLIGYFKYASFLAQTLIDLGIGLGIAPKIILPLAISFFTFQQIAYLIDAFHSRQPEHDPVRYALFVMFFPATYCRSDRSSRRNPRSIQAPTVAQLGFQCVHRVDHIHLGPFQKNWCWQVHPEFLLMPCLMPPNGEKQLV